MLDCIFCQIRDGIIPKEFTYEDEEVMVFPDIHPLKPIHLLIVPKEHIEDFIEFNNLVLLGKIKDIAQKLIKEQGLLGKGYRLEINGGGAQIIDHLHIHLMGPMGKAAEM